MNEVSGFSEDPNGDILDSGQSSHGSVFSNLINGKIKFNVRCVKHHCSLQSFYLLVVVLIPCNVASGFGRPPLRQRSVHAWEASFHELIKRWFELLGDHGFCVVGLGLQLRSLGASLAYVAVSPAVATFGAVFAGCYSVANLAASETLPPPFKEGWRWGKPKARSSVVGGVLT